MLPIDFFIALRIVDLGGENRHWCRYLMSSSFGVICYALMSLWLLWLMTMFLLDKRH